MELTYEKVHLMKEPEPLEVTHGNQENFVYKVWFDAEKTDELFIGWIVNVDNEWIFDPNPDILDLLNESRMFEIAGFLKKLKTTNTSFDEFSYTSPVF
jgi:hypothetical protein